MQDTKKNYGKRDTQNMGRDTMGNLDTETKLYDTKK
jgi:hypothetical protein